MDKITIDIEQKYSNDVLNEYAAKFADLKKQEKQEKNVSSSGEEEKSTQKKTDELQLIRSLRYRICRYDIKQVNEIDYL